MTILSSLAREFQFLFPLTKSGQERFRWFVLPLQAILVPITYESGHAYDRGQVLFRASH